MEATVTILRELWRRRIFVALAALVAILIGLMLAYTISLPPESRQYEVGVASGRILVDTPDSQIVEVSPKGSSTLGLRANLLANLMTEGEVKAAIAPRAGLRQDQLHAGIETVDGLPPSLSSAADNPRANVLTTRLATNPDGTPLPIIEVSTQAPDAAGAARLVNAAVAGLGAYLDSKAAEENIASAEQLQVTALGTPQVREDIRGPRRLVALGVAVFIFLGWCAVILVAPELARRWRAASEEEGPSDDGATAGIVRRPSRWWGRLIDYQRASSPARKGTATRSWRAKLRPVAHGAAGAPRPADDGDSSADEGSARDLVQEAQHDSALADLPLSPPDVRDPRRTERGAGAIGSAGSPPAHHSEPAPSEDAPREPHSDTAVNELGARGRA